MGLMERVMNLVQDKRDTQTLYVSMDYIPQPRDWSTVERALGNNMLISRKMSLQVDGTQALLGLIECNMEKIRTSGYQKVQYLNVEEHLQGQINHVLKT